MLIARIISLAGPALAGYVLLFSRCSTNPWTADGGTETGNAAVYGTIYEPDGKTPAAGARVLLIPTERQPTVPGLSKTLAAIPESTTTNDSGIYTVKSMPSGTYSILASGDGNVAFQDSIAVKADERTKVPADTLKAPGSIRGRVRLQPGDDARLVFILFMGTNAYCLPDDSMGAFTTPDLAEGTYRVRILSTIDQYGVLDTTLSVSAGKINMLGGDIVLPFKGIGVVTGLRVSHDTLREIVTLSWHTENQVAGFNVYRANVDSNTVANRINSTRVVDTLFHDSTVAQDFTYQYTVATTDAQGNEGNLGNGVTVKAVGPYVLVDSIGYAIFERPLDLVVRSDGRIFVTDDTVGLVILDNEGAYQRTLPCGSFPRVNLKRVFKMAQDESGNLYVTGDKDYLHLNQGVVLKLSSEDTLMSTFGDSGSADGLLGTPRQIAVHDTLVLVENADDRRIKVFSAATGRYLYSIGGAGQAPGQFVEIAGLAVSKTKRLFVAEETRIQMFELDGSIVGSFDISLGVPSDLRLDDEDRVLVLSMTENRLYGFTENGALSLRFQVSQREPHWLYVDQENTLYIGDLISRFCRKYSRR